MGWPGFASRCGPASACSAATSSGSGAPSPSTTPRAVAAASTWPGCVVGVLEKRHGVVCAQVAVAPLSEVCFPSFLDVSSKPTREAVRQFARLLVRLTRAWR